MSSSARSRSTARVFDVSAPIRRGAAIEGPLVARSGVVRPYNTVRGCPRHSAGRTTGVGMTMKLSPLTPHLGADITDIAGHELLEPGAADDCLAALEQYGVVVYRAIGISDEDLIAFSRLLGEVAVVPTGEHEHPEIQTITL